MATKIYALVMAALQLWQTLNLIEAASRYTLPRASRAPAPSSASPRKPSRTFCGHGIWLSRSCAPRIGGEVKD